MQYNALIPILLFFLAIQPSSARNYTLRPQGKADRTAEVIAIIDRMRRGDSLILEQGEYHFHDTAARPMELYPSNNTGGMKHVVFPIVDKRGITIDGRGSTLVFYGEAFPFALLQSRRICLKNFTITTRYPSAIQFRMTEKRADGFRVRLGDDTDFRTDEEGNIHFSTGGTDVRTNDERISVHAIDHLSICYLMTPLSAGDKNEFPAGFMGIKGHAVDAHTLDCQYYGDPHPKSILSPFSVGERVVLNLAEKRRQIACFMDGSEDVCVSGVKVRRFGGMAFVAQRSGDIDYDRIDVWPAAGEDVSVTADIFQCINCYGHVSITNTRAGHSLDDAINVHGNYLRVEQAQGHTLQLRACHLQHERFFPYRPGDSLEIVDSHTRRLLAKARVRRMIPSEEDGFLCQVEVRETVDTIPAGALVENITLCPDVTIKGCRLSHFPHIRLSGRGLMRVEDNDISHCYKALMGNDLAEYWYEAGRLSTLIIRNNRFRSCTALGGNCVMSFGVSGWGADAPKIHGRVVLEGNTYEDCPLRYQAEGVRELTDRDNDNNQPL